MSSLLEGETGMIALKQSKQKQRVVIEFLLLEGETAQNISRRLKEVYGEDVIDRTVELAKKSMAPAPASLK